MIRQIAPQFFTTDILRTLSYYEDKLGFERLGTWQDPPVYAIMARDQHAIHFRCAEPPKVNPHKYTDEQMASLGTDLEKIRAIPFMKGAGCDTCSGTGYKGRAGLYEVMALSAELRRMILRGASVSEMQEQAVSEGMLTLRMDGLKKIERGITTLEEVVKETAG